MNRVSQNTELFDFVANNGKEASRTPDLHYNPQKEMKKAEDAYLASKGIVKLTRWQKIKSFFKKKIEFD